MGKATILEAQNSDTVFEKGKTNGVLGKLKGIFADFTKGTRNSDRLYSEELWDECVFNNEDVMEALETRTLFGELDHPEGDRCETLAKNAAISITKLEKNPEEGVIYGEADILDTPTGRTLYSIAQTGAKFGVSSRGIGEEIIVEGQNQIDPNTYDFITFDVVVTPANEKARVSLTEGKQRGKLLETFKKEIKQSDTTNQLNQIKSVVNYINSVDKTEILNLVEAKLKSIDKATQAKKDKLEEANRQIALDLIKNKMQDKNQVLEESTKAISQLSEENAKLLEQLTYYKESKKVLQTEFNKLEESKNSTVKKLNSLLVEKAKLKQETLLESKSSLTKISELTENYNKQLSEMTAKYENQIAKLTENSNKAKHDNAILIEANTKLTKKLEHQSKILIENSQLKLKVENLEKTSMLSKQKLEESKKINNNKIVNLERQIKQLQEEKELALESEARYSKLSFNPIGNMKLQVESRQTESDYSEEDEQLFNVLTYTN